MLLTFQEFSEISSEGISEEEFTRLLIKAESAVHSLTRRHYHFHDLDSDVEWRKQAVKKAVAFQIEYFHEAGASSSYSLKHGELSSVSMGRTSISRPSRNRSAKTEDPKLVCEETYNELLGTGLLWRGAL